jgi:large subunit ribosomal protein L37e
MAKGTPSMGRKSGKVTHGICRRCGQRTFHLRHKKCSSCGFGDTKKLRSYKWQNKL